MRPPPVLLPLFVPLLVPLSSPVLVPLIKRNISRLSGGGSKWWAALSVVRQRKALGICSRALTAMGRYCESVSVYGRGRGKGEGGEGRMSVCVGEEETCVWGVLHLYWGMIDALGVVCASTWHVADIEINLPLTVAPMARPLPVRGVPSKWPPSVPTPSPSLNLLSRIWRDPSEIRGLNDVMS